MFFRKETKNEEEKRNVAYGTCCTVPYATCTYRYGTGAGALRVMRVRINDACYTMSARNYLLGPLLMTLAAVYGKSVDTLNFDS
jgi:hypothetical protein